MLPLSIHGVNCLLRKNERKRPGMSNGRDVKDRARVSTWLNSRLVGCLYSTIMEQEVCLRESLMMAGSSVISNLCSESIYVFLEK